MLIIINAAIVVGRSATTTATVRPGDHRTIRDRIVIALNCRGDYQMSG